MIHDNLCGKSQEKKKTTLQAVSQSLAQEDNKEKRFESQMKKP